MKGNINRQSGLRDRRLFSVLVVAFFLTGVLAVLPFGTQNAKAYTTPGTGVVWDMDDLVANSGGAVTGDSGSYVFHDWWVTISAGDTLNVLPGDICSFEAPLLMPPFELEVQGSIYALGGDVGITFTSNETSPSQGDWEWIFINGGYGQFENVVVEYSNYGIYVYNTAGTDIVSNCTFRHNSDSGLGYWQVGGNPEVRDCYFTDTGNPAIYTGDTSLRVINNTIYGWNAPPGSFMSGGDAIYITGNPSMTTTISQNTIIGGSGDEYGIAGQPPDGGHAIWLDNHEGMAAGTQVFIESNTLLKGGDGGRNTIDNGMAGAGGAGIYCSPLPDNNQWWIDEYSIEVFNNQQIIGGHGGDNNAALDGNSGDGGHGIYVYDDDSLGSTLVSANQYVTGGYAGNSSASDSGGGTWQVGDGGAGIFAEWCYIGTKTDVINNQLITGGKGGNTTAIAAGNFGFAGIGGNGITFKGTTNASIDSNEIFGGDGGDNMGTNIFAGDGGDGIHLEPYGDFESSAGIMTCDSTGGKGGDDFASGGPGGGGAGTGGVGLSVNGTMSYAWAMDSNFTGGKGGNIHADGSFGGTGGRGIHVYQGAGVSTWNSGRIIGGDGGDTLYNGPPGIGTWAGSGGTGIWVENVMTMLNIGDQSLITGGDGGDNWFDTIGMAGDGAGAIIGFSADMIDIQQNSDITTGSGGYDWPTGTYGSQGDQIIWMDNIAFGATVSWNTIHDSDFYGIQYTNCDGQIRNNEIFNCWFIPNPFPQNSGTGIYCSNSNPLIESNYIHDNNYSGISCTNCDPIIRLNTIANTDHNGIYLSGSSSHIDRTTIDNSTDYGIYLIDGSSPDPIENCTISNSGIGDFYLDTNSHPVCLNTINDKTTVFNDALSTLTMNWFMHVQVVDPTFTPVGGAEVWVNDTFGTSILNAFTPANGWLNWTVVTEFIEDQASRIYYTNHNGTAIAGLQTGWATPEPFMGATHSVTIVLGLPAWNLYLDPGWNLISIPLEQTDTTISTVLSSIDGQYDVVKYYDTTDTNDPWKTYRPGASTNDLYDIDHKMGFWIHTNAPAPCLTVIGSVPVTTEIFLYTGWNLVGYPSFTPLDAAAALLGTGYDGLAEFDGANPYLLRDMLGTDIMNPGQGYWVHVPVDAIWTVDW